MNDFHKIILSALLKCMYLVFLFSYLFYLHLAQISDATSKGNAQLKRNLILTLEWKLPDLALSEIFQRDDDTKIFYSR